MAVSGVKVGIAVGVGIIDEIVEEWDAKAGRTEPFRKATDWARLALAGIGYLTQTFAPKYGAIGEGLALSSTPLLVKSIAKSVKGVLVAREKFVPRPVPSKVVVPQPLPKAEERLIIL